jgi:hypothetical protein
MTTTYCRTVDVSGIRLFYREAGPLTRPCCYTGSRFVTGYLSLVKSSPLTARASRVYTLNAPP